MTDLVTDFDLLSLPRNLCNLAHKWPVAIPERVLGPSDLQNTSFLQPPTQSVKTGHTTDYVTATESVKSSRNLCNLESGRDHRQQKGTNIPSNICMGSKVCKCVLVRYFGR